MSIMPTNDPQGLDQLAAVLAKLLRDPRFAGQMGQGMPGSAPPQLSQLLANRYRMANNQSFVNPAAITGGTTQGGMPSGGAIQWLGGMPPGYDDRVARFVAGMGAASNILQAMGQGRLRNKQASMLEGMGPQEAQRMMAYLGLF